jgi:hypothetical protein
MKRPALNADHITIAFLIALVIIIFGIALSYGCRSTPCVPRVEIQEVDVPQPCIIQVGVLEPLTLPPFPVFDASNPKEWSLQVEQIVKQREALLTTRLAALNYQIEEHNRLEPKCKP